jgi:tRNA-specific 2-thiouridylase
MKILLGMSGGVDSAYSAIKLKEMGHDVTGIFLLMHDYADVEGARACAADVGIPLIVEDCRKAFSQTVEKKFAEEYLCGRTPNPCIICNAEIKFKRMYEIAREKGFDKIATGHYASVRERDGLYSVLRARDEKKDQSYVLWRLGQDILSMMLFPLWDDLKSEVKERTREKGVSAAYKEESQEICFIPDNDYATYIESNYKKSRSGAFVDEEGRVLGEHKGIIHYTVGQRKGLGISASERLFVKEIDAEKNKIILSPEDRVGRDSFYINDMVFSGLVPMEEGELDLFVKVRYLAPPVRAHITFEGARARVDLTEKRVITPGQSAVFYDENAVMLGGFIE